MAYIFKTVVTRTDKASGLRVPVVDAKGRQEYHPQWRFRITDYQGRRRVMTGTASKVETEKLAAQVQSENDQIRRGYKPPPKANAHAALRPFGELVEEWLEAGRSCGGRGGRPWSQGHDVMRTLYINWWQDRLKPATLSALSDSLPRIEEALRTLKNNGKSSKTCFHYQTTITSFVKWCFQRGYCDRDFLEHIGSWSAAPTTVKRPLSLEECQRLLTACRPEVRDLYELAMSSGLRAGEIRSLRVGDLNPDAGGVTLRAEITKNRKPGLQPLPKSLLDRLIALSAGKAPSDSLLFVPRHPAQSLSIDLERAGISKRGPGGVVDFHSLRRSFISMVVDAGADIRSGMDLARHSSPGMTFSTYARSRWDKKSELVESIGVKLQGGINSDLGITEAQPKAALANTPLKSSSYLVAGLGFEPRTFGL